MKIVLFGRGGKVGRVLEPALVAGGHEVVPELVGADAAVDFTAPPSVIGKTTAAALQSGLVYGFAGQVDEIVRQIRGELGADAPTVATGGLAELIVPHAATLDRIDHDLTLDGLRRIWELNQAT